MKKTMLMLLLMFVIVGCENDPKENPPEISSLVGEWYEVSSTDDWGTKAIFTDTTMSVIGYGFTAQDHIWMDTLCTYTPNLGYKVIPNSELEFEHRPGGWTIPNYKTNYTFKSADTLFIEKVWDRFLTNEYPKHLTDILLCRRNK